MGSPRRIFLYTVLGVAGVAVALLSTESLLGLRRYFRQLSLVPP
jgi:hypothetical protein